MECAGVNHGDVRANMLCTLRGPESCTIHRGHFIRIILLLTQIVFLF
jgi:hypothetical protein